MNASPARGTTPPGAGNEAEASRWVREMFSRVAWRYDLLNHLLSFNIDRYWRARTVRELRSVLHRPGSRVLDICCGTGDLAIALEKEKRSGIVASDFCRPMLIEAREKLSRKRLGTALVEADALNLPVPDACLDLITVAFGFRNLSNYRKGLEEMHRVLKPSGVAAILEFSTPPNPLFAAAYDFYSRHVLSRLGGVISGSGDAYRYLPESVRKFPGADELAREMAVAGFTGVRYIRMTGGIVALHLGTKAVS